MRIQTIMGGAASVAFVAFLSLGPTQAAMTPVLHDAVSNIQRVDCAVGMHIGPAGGCILGTEEHHDRVIEDHRAADEGCDTKSVKRTDAAGNTETHTRTNCN